MMHDIFENHVTSQPVSDGPSKISVFLQLPRPQSLFQTGELAKQSPPAKTLDDPHHLPYRPRRRERNHHVDMLRLNFHLLNLKFILFTDLLDHLFRSFPDLLPLKDILPVFRTPDQMVNGVVDRMTRPLQRHALFIAHL